MKKFWSVIKETQTIICRKSSCRSFFTAELQECMMRTIPFNSFINSLDDRQSALSAYLLRNRTQAGVIGQMIAPHFR